MAYSTDILAIAHKQQVLAEDLELLHQKEKQIPGTWSYQIQRYRRHSFWNAEDTGVFVYHMEPDQPERNYMELRFCVMGNGYCVEKEMDCDHCRMSRSMHCEHKTPTVDVLNFRFEPAHLSQFAKGMKASDATEDIMQFRTTSSFTRILPLCSKMRTSIDSLLNHSYTDTLENIFVNAQTQILLLYSMECMMGVKEEPMISCKFLHNEADREKISMAREILIEHIGDPITIKELSRKVAINECYLKKGFKEMFGTTIFDFYQNQRMEHARYLLYEKGLSVSEVSAMLGYSSISHFSTAFKKHTGIKPCELLIRNG
jgi:AraC family transcriptional regulator